MEEQGVRRMLVTLGIAVAALAAQAAPAAATTVSTTSGGGFRQIVITGDALENRISFFVLQGQTEATLVISDLAATVQAPIVVAPGSAGCATDASGGATCRVDAGGGAPVDTIRVLGGAGDDAVNAETGHDWEFEMALDGGPGNDVLALGSSHGSAVGGEGDDALTGELFDNRYDAGPGDDTVVSGWGDDTIDLGAGRDRAVAQGGGDTIVAQDGEADEVDCGGGTDNVRGDQRDLFKACETSAVLVTPDADGDGVAPPEDCDDGDAAVKPGQNETPANGKDDDCVGGDAASTARVRATIRYGFKVHRRFTRVTSLVLSGYEPGIAVTLRCRGRGCPFKVRPVKRITGKRLSLARPVRRSSFRRGATLEVWVTKPGTVGKALRIRFRKGKPPRATSLCLPDGARGPQPCA